MTLTFFHFNLGIINLIISLHECNKLLLNKVGCSWKAHTKKKRKDFIYKCSQKENSTTLLIGYVNRKFLSLCKHEWHLLHPEPLLLNTKYNIIINKQYLKFLISYLVDFLRITTLECQVFWFHTFPTHKKMVVEKVAITANRRTKMKFLQNFCLKFYIRRGMRFSNWFVD